VLKIINFENGVNEVRLLGWVKCSAEEVVKTKAEDDMKLNPD